MAIAIFALSIKGLLYLHFSAGIHFTKEKIDSSLLPGLSDTPAFS